MKLTIIPADGSVGEDEKFYLELDLSSCAIPADVHALQWQDTVILKFHLMKKMN